MAQQNNKTDVHREADAETVPVHQLVYISASSHEFGDEELVHLLAVARRNNTALGVSGMLLYHEKSFIQVLEGDKVTVEKLFQKISTDSRHTESRVLFRGTVDASSFNDWSMGFYNSGKSNLSSIDGLNKVLPQGFSGKTESDCDLARRTLLAFRDGKWRQAVEVG